MSAFRSLIGRVSEFVFRFGTTAPMEPGSKFKKCSRSAAVQEPIARSLAKDDRLSIIRGGLTAQRESGSFFQRSGRPGATAVSAPTGANAPWHSGGMVEMLVWLCVHGGCRVIVFG